MTCVVRAARRIFGATDRSPAPRREDPIARLSAIVHARRAEAKRTERVADAAWRASNERRGSIAAYEAARKESGRAAALLDEALNDHFDASENARIRRIG